VEQYVYQFRLDPDLGKPIEVSRLRSVKGMIDHYYSNLTIKQARVEVEKLIGGWCTERTWYEVSKPCLTCGQHPGKPVIPAGELKAEYYCDECRPT